jgi:hypothetical protein
MLRVSCHLIKIVIMSLLIIIKREVASRPSIVDDGLVDPRNLLPPENDDTVLRIITRP